MELNLVFSIETLTRKNILVQAAMLFLAPISALGFLCDLFRQFCEWKLFYPLLPACELDFCPHLW